MKLTVSKKADAIKDSGVGGLINKSGVYPVTLNYTQVAESKGGAYQLIFNVTHTGMDQTIYGPYLTDKKKNVNEITQALLNKLCIIAGMEEGQDIETESVENPVGKDRKMMAMEVIPELSELDVQIRIQMEYSMYEGKIQEKQSIKAFYREDGATAAEIVAGEGFGKRLATDIEKYADNVTYRDGLTEEDVKAWIEEQRKARSGNGSSTPSPSAKPAAKRPLFQSGN